MAFPVSPTEGQTYTENNTVWIYSAVTGQWNRSVINPLNETTYIGSDGAPGGVGSNTQVIFNDNGSLAGDADLTWNKTTNKLTAAGDIELNDGVGTFSTTLQTVTPTANRTISFPDATGTVALVAGSSGQLLYNNAGANAGVPSSVIGATGDVTLALNGAASTPPLDVTGTWFTGGTSTTTKPQVLIEPAGTTSTAWSTSGTGLGVNAASGFTGRLLDLQTNGTSRAVVTGAGQLLVGTSTSVENVGGNIQVNGGNATINTFGAVSAAYRLYFVKSRSGTFNGKAIVQSGDDLGMISFNGDDGFDYASEAASISCQVDGTPGSNDMPGRLVFSTTADGAASPTERMRITSDGYVRLASGTGGIQFNGDTAAANALDDYEEGTFTVTVEGSTTAGTATYGTRQGNYRKVGNLVTVWYYVTWSSFTGTGDQRIVGLPFTSINANAAQPVILESAFTLPASTLYVSGFVWPNNSYMVFNATRSGAGAAAVQCNAIGTIYGTATYATTA